jgi:hypothetical protein
MNRKAFLISLGGATAALVAGPLFAADSTQTHTQVPIDHLPAPVAEPSDASSYAPPTVDLGEGPSAADFGPAQRPFVMASQTDNLANNPDAPITNTVPNEIMALDKHVRVPVVHDVQDDSSYRGGQNDSLLFEIKYLNWGAITSEQLKARQGHYFTITFVNDGPRSDFTTLFEYRQVKSKALVRSLSQERLHVHGAARAYFAVVNQAYLAYGPVSAWRFTVRHGNTVVAEAKSFLW